MSGPITNRFFDQARSPEHTLEHVIPLGSGAWDAMLANVAICLQSSCCRMTPANIQYTSGSTGSPKGVVLTHRNLVNNGLLTGENIRMTERDRMCIGLPLYHCGGLSVHVTITGGHQGRLQIARR